MALVSTESGEHAATLLCARRFTLKRGGGSPVSFVCENQQAKSESRLRGSWQRGPRGETDTSCDKRKFLRGSRAVLLYKHLMASAVFLWESMVAGKHLEAVFHLPAAVALLVMTARDERLEATLQVRSSNRSMHSLGYVPWGPAVLCRPQPCATPGRLVAP